MAKIPNMKLALRCDGEKLKNGIVEYFISQLDLIAETDISKGDVIMTWPVLFFDTPMPIDRVFLTPANARILATALNEMASDIEGRNN